MKKLVSWFLISSIAFQLTGCYTFSEMELNNDSNFIVEQIEDNDIKIKLRNGEEIFSKAYYHTFNTDSVDLIVGQGTIYSAEKKKSEGFGGKILKDEIDSVRIDKNFLFILLKNKDRITIEKSNYIEIQADSTKGFLYTDNGTPNIVPFYEIQTFEVEEYNSTLTTIGIIGTAVLIIGLVLGLTVFDGPIFSFNNSD